MVRVVVHGVDGGEVYIVGIRIGAGTGGGSER